MTSQRIRAATSRENKPNPPKQTNKYIKLYKQILHKEEVRVVERGAAAAFLVHHC